MALYPEIRPSINPFVVALYTSSCHNTQGYFCFYNQRLYHTYRCYNEENISIYLNLHLMHAMQHIVLWSSHVQIQPYLCGSVVKGHIKHVRLLPGTMRSQDVIWIFQRVHQHYHLRERRAEELEVKVINLSL